MPHPVGAPVLRSHGNKITRWNYLAARRNWLPSRRKGIVFRRNGTVYGIVLCHFFDLDLLNGKMMTRNPTRRKRMAPIQSIEMIV